MEGPNDNDHETVRGAPKHPRTERYQSGSSDDAQSQHAYSQTATPVYRYIWKTMAADDSSSARHHSRPTRRSALSLNLDRTGSSSNNTGPLFSPSVRNRDMYINRAAVPSNELSLSDVFESLDLDDDRRIRVKEDLPVALRVLGLEWPMYFTDAFSRGGIEELERIVHQRKKGSSGEPERKSSIVREHEVLDPHDRGRTQRHDRRSASDEEETGVTGAANPPPPPPRLMEQNKDRKDNERCRRSSEGNNLRSSPAMERHTDRDKISFSTFCNIVNVLQRNGASRKDPSTHRYWRHSTNSIGSSFLGSSRNMQDLGTSVEEASVPRSIEQSLTATSLSTFEEVHTKLSHSAQIAQNRIMPESDTNQDVSSSQNPEGRRCPLGEVFLGGACNPTTWRADIAMPLLEKHGVTYYNPQVENWTPDLIEVEANAKEEALILMFVVTGETRAVASMIEIAEYISTKRDVVVVLQDVEPGTQISGHELYADELKDLNRGRAYLADVADRKGVKVFQNITKAVEHVVSRIKSIRGEEEGE